MKTLYLPIKTKFTIVHFLRSEYLTYPIKLFKHIFHMANQPFPTIYTLNLDIR